MLCVLQCCELKVEHPMLHMYNLTISSRNVGVLDAHEVSSHPGWHHCCISTNLGISWRTSSSGLKFLCQDSDQRCNSCSWCLPSLCRSAAFSSNYSHDCKCIHTMACGASMPSCQPEVWTQTQSTKGVVLSCMFRSADVSINTGSAEIA